MSDEKKRAMNTPMMHQEKSELKCTELKEKQTDTVYRKRSEIIVENVRLTVGQLIALRRRELGWSQEDLAWETGISRTQIGRIERDESVPLVSSIEELEVVLGIELYDLFMARKRDCDSGRKRRKRHLISGVTLDQFEEELVRKGISEDDLKDILDEAIKSAENRIDNGAKAPHMENAREWCRLLEDCFSGRVNLIVTQKTGNVSDEPQELNFISRILANQTPPVGIYFISEDIYTLASYYREDMDDKVLLPDEWKTLPKDELDMLKLESAAENLLPKEGDGAQKEVTGNAGMDT